MTSRRRLACGIMLLGGAALSVAAWPAEAVANVSGQQVKTGSLVDHDYAFRLTPGDPDWRLMTEEEIGKFTPDAVAGVTKKDASVWGAVIVERAGGSLDGYADLVIENAPLENKRILEKKPIEFLDRRAIRFVIQGTIQSVDVRYATVVVSREDWTYQVTSWALAKELRSSDPLLRVHDMFFFLDAPIRGRESLSTLSDAHGPGWRLVDGAFESAAYRLAVRPTEGWRLIIGDELQSMNAAAEVGLQHGMAEVYAAVIPEVAWVDDEEEFVNFVRDALAETLMAESSETIRFEIDGKQRSFDVYRADVGIEMEFLHATWFDAHICYQVLVWYTVESRDRAKVVVQPGLASLDFLGAEETKTLLAALSELPDPTNTVGPDFALRGGLYRDFANSASWSVPEDGIWDVVVGQEARDESPIASLAFEEKGWGLNGLLLVEEVGEMTAAAFHEAVVENTMANTGTTERPAPRQIRKDDSGGWTTRISPPTTEGQPPIDFHVATFVRNGVGVQLSIYGVPANMAAGEALVESAVAGFDWLPVEMGTAVIEDGVLRDWRLGFGVKTPEGFEGPLEITPASIVPIGSIVSVTSKGASLAAIGLCPDVDRLDETFFLDFVEPMIRKELAQDMVLAESSDAKLDGRKAAHRIFASKTLQAHVFIAIRGRTIYGLVIVAETDEQVERLRKSFFFLD